jgi:hypothetical protein
VSIVLAASQTAEATDTEKINLPDKVVQQILDSLGAKTVAIKMGNQRKLLAVADVPPTIHHNVDLRDPSMVRAVWEALESLFLCSDNDIVRVVGQAPMGADFIEIVLAEGPLRAAMFRFSRNILLLSLVISAITATLVYLSLHFLFVRPMHRLTENMVKFREAPENANSARCSATSSRCCSRRATSRRSGSRSRKSTTTCATCSPPRSSFRTGFRAFPIRPCSVSPPS